MPLDCENDSLDDWSVHATHKWDAILIGNGLGLNISERFNYGSLLKAAELAPIAAGITPLDRKLFDAFGTNNFEVVLAGLAQAMRAAKALASPSEKVFQGAYDRIRASLVAAVCSHHVEWRDLPLTTFLEIKEELKAYQYVFTTNYDLLIYWAINHGPTTGFKDYFWDGSFPPQSIEVPLEATKLLFLHGGLHLYLDGAGDARKRMAGWEQSLLASLKVRLEDEQAPLFVAEGTAREKRRSIESSEYLSFAYRNLQKKRDRVVVFGHALGPSDTHLVSALNASKPCKLAVAICRGSSDDVIQAKASILQKFPRLDVVYFDASTHPLGKATLTLPCKEC